MIKPSKSINSYVILDFETGGLDKKDGNHSQKYPVTEFACIAITGFSLEEILRYDDYIRPYDNGLIYDPEAARLTGITKDICAVKGISLRELVDNICQVAKEANVYNSKTAKPVLVAHNADFDRQFFQDIFKRADVKISDYFACAKDAYGNEVPHIIDTIDDAKKCWGDIADAATKFKLTHCCERAGISIIDAHRAMNDVEALTELFKYFLLRTRSTGSQVGVDNENKVLVQRRSFEWC